VAFNASHHATSARNYCTITTNCAPKWPPEDLLITPHRIRNRPLGSIQAHNPCLGSWLCNRFQSHTNAEEKKPDCPIREGCSYIEFEKPVNYFWPSRKSHTNLKDRSLARSLDPYGYWDLLPRSTHGLDTKSRACVDDNKHDILHHLFIRPLRLSPPCLSLDYFNRINTISSPTHYARFPNFAHPLSTDFFCTIYSICQPRPPRLARPHALTAFISSNESTINHPPPPHTNGSICSHS
jgi:hypothetical protein